MKLFTIILLSLALGVVLTISNDFDESQALTSGQLKLTDKSERLLSSTGPKSDPQSKNLPPAKSREDFLKDYEKLSTAELENELKLLEELQRKEALIERANKGEVNEELSRVLTEYIRADFVVRNLILERKLDELEELL